MFRHRFLIISLCSIPVFAQIGFDPSAMDTSVSACNDFYQYACGSWLKNNPVPADQSAWGRFSELHERNQRNLRDILETSAAKSTRTAVEQKIGDYFASCMDEKGVEARGIAPLKPTLDRVNGLSSKAALTDELIRLHAEGVGAMFSVNSSQDFKNAAEVIADVDQGGLGLPERDYYFKDDAKSVELRKLYVAHVRRMFELLGHNSSAAEKKAATVMSIETGLAKGHLDVTSRRDPNKIYHRMAVKELAALAPAIDWNRYLAGIGAPVTTLNVAVPDFFKQMDAQIKAVTLDDWKVYLTWHVTRAAAPLLTSAFVNENFNFYSRP
jgi:putative endopeptidase